MKNDKLEQTLKNQIIITIIVMIMIIGANLMLIIIELNRIIKKKSVISIK